MPGFQDLDARIVARRIAHEGTPAAAFQSGKVEAGADTIEVGVEVGGVFVALATIKGGHYDALQAAQQQQQAGDQPPEPPASSSPPPQQQQPADLATAQQSGTASSGLGQWSQPPADQPPASGPPPSSQ